MISQTKEFIDCDLEQNVPDINAGNISKRTPQIELVIKENHATTTKQNALSFYVPSALAERKVKDGVWGEK